MNRGILNTPFRRLPWYHKLWLAIPYGIIVSLNKLFKKLNKSLGVGRK